MTSQAKQRAVALRAHGLRAPPDDQADLARNGTTTATMTAAPAGATQDETIHTTANHPWLTTDRCWVLAGDLHTGEPVRTLDGQTALVAWVHTVSGQADYYNLTVADDHTYAVGDGQYVVHNATGPCGELSPTVEAVAEDNSTAEVGKPHSLGAGVIEGSLNETPVNPALRTGIIGADESETWIFGHNEPQTAGWMRNQVRELAEGGATGRLTATIITVQEPCTACMAQMETWATQIQAEGRGAVDVDVRFLY